jgi:hypothetical protein
VQKKSRTFTPLWENARARDEPDGPHRHRPSPEETVVVARAGVVSWLRDRRTHLPGREASGARVREFLPLQWRGRTGITPVSVAPARHMNCGLNLRRRSRIFNGLRRHELVHQFGATVPVEFRATAGARRVGRVDVIQSGNFAGQRFGW